MESSNGREPLTDINRVLKFASDLGASDVHIKPGKPPMLRVNGELHPLPNSGPLTPQVISAMARKIMNEKQIEEYKEQQEVDLAYSLPGVGRFRANVFQQRGSVAISLRTIPTLVKTFADLSLPKVLEGICEAARGMILVTGATGSGKSTTLAAMIDHINTKYARHIVTIEDPIEFLLRDKKSIISQREVGFDTPSFPKALRSALRQDPDVVLVGEMRDLETITTALMAAETGHLVLSTLHTVDVMETIHRILSFYPSHQLNHVRFQLASALKAIISQRLVPTIGGKGRVPAVEVMVTNSRIRDCIKNAEKTHEILDAMMQGATTDNMQTYDMSLLSLIQKKLITFEEALRNSSNPGDLALKLKGFSSTADADFDQFSKEQKSKPVAKKKAKSDNKMIIERFSK